MYQRSSLLSLICHVLLADTTTLYTAVRRLLPLNCSWVFVIHCGNFKGSTTVNDMEEF